MGNGRQHRQASAHHTISGAAAVLFLSFTDIMLHGGVIRLGVVHMHMLILG